MKSQNKINLDLTHGSVTGKLIAFTMPILASNMLQHLYNAADKAVVGRFAENGDLALAATGATGTAITLLLNLFVGLSLGTNVVCANLRGASKPKALRKAMHTSILLATITGMFAMILGIFVAEPFLVAMSCPEDVLDLATLYMRIYFVGVPFSLLYNFGAAILRAHGDTKRPMNILAISGLANVGLNLVFVICFHMDVDGVAWATVISQVISAAVVLWILFKPDGGYDLNLRELKFHKKELTSVIRVGIPCGLNGMVFSIANVIIASSINSLGSVAVGGSSAAGGITGIVYQVLAAFYSACISFAGQCYGAGMYKRIDKLVISSILLGSGMMAVLSLAATLFPCTLLSLFTDNADYIRSGTAQMLITCWSYILYGISESFLGCLRGMQRSGMPTLLNAASICMPRLIWVFVFFPMCQEVWFLYLCYPISYVFSAATQGLYYLSVRRKLDKQTATATK